MRLGMARYAIVEFPSPTNGPAPNPWTGQGPSSENLLFARAIRHMFEHVTHQSLRLGWTLKRAEAAVVQSLVEFGGSLRQNIGTFDRASLRHRQLAIESVGLAVLADLVAKREGPIVATYDFDAQWLRVYLRGARPDLLLHCDSGKLIAGEARGRTTRRGKVTRATQEHRRRWNRLAGVSTQLWISWTYVGPTSTHVALFDPGEPQRATPAQDKRLRGVQRDYFDALHAQAPTGDFGEVWRDLDLRGEWREHDRGWLFTGITGVSIEPQFDQATVNDGGRLEQADQIDWGNRVVVAYRLSSPTEPDLEDIRSRSQSPSPRIRST